MNIRIVTETLSDGSKVSNVVLSQDEGSITLHAVTKADAYNLARELFNLVASTTVDAVKVV
jgi:hypothetical protein